MDKYKKSLKDIGCKKGITEPLIYLTWNRFTNFRLGKHGV